MTEYDVSDMITPLDAAVKDGCTATMVEIPFRESHTDPSGCTVNADGYERWIKLSLRNGWSFREFGYNIDGTYTGWWPNNDWYDGSIHYGAPKVEQRTQRENKDDSTTSTSSLFYPEGRDESTVSAEVLSECQKMARFVYDDSFERYRNFGRNVPARGLLIQYNIARRTEKTDLDTMLEKLPFSWGERNSINYIKLQKRQLLTINHNPSRKHDLGTITGGGYHDVYTPVTLTATPNAGYRFVYWATKYYAKTEDILSRDRVFTLEQMPTDPTTIYAHFDGATPGIVYNPLVSGNPIAFRRRIAGDPALNPYPIIAR